MSKQTVLGALILATALLTITCTTPNTQSYANVSPPTPVTSEGVAQQFPTPLPSPSPTSMLGSPIRSIDFDNVTYSHFPDYGASKVRYITLKAGQGKPSYRSYGDITNDGIEEAMAVLSVDSRGSAILHNVYIFAMEGGKLKLLWTFETGDRADGGLRQVYAENGDLVIELFGKNRVIGTDLYKGDEGLCCPSSFTRTFYKWTANNFQQTKQEVLANPKGNASPVMADY